VCGDTLCGWVAWAQGGGEPSAAAAASASKRRKGGGGKAVQAAAVTLLPFPAMQPAAVESLRYRAEDVARTVGRAAVKDARVRAHPRLPLSTVSCSLNCIASPCLPC
jgi:hypothetical protein